MTHDAQRIAIAESDGWIREKSKLPLWRRGNLQVTKSELPDYTADYNAIHAAIASLPMEQQWSVFTALAHYVADEKPAFMGSAAEYAKAFLFVVGAGDTRNEDSAP